MTETISIRDLAVEDLDSSLDVMEAVAAEGRWVATELPFDRAERRRRLATGMEKGTTLMCAAVDGERIVGNAGLDKVAPGLWGLGMAILADWRGRGLGGRLLDHLLDRARENDAHKITLEVWPHNEAAIRLYEKYGFEREGYLRHHYRRKNGEIWDAIVMGLVLGSGATAPAMKRGRQ